MDKFGPNEEQMEKFVDAALNLEFEAIGPVVAETRTPMVRDAQDATAHVRLSASRYSAIDSAARGLVSALLKRFPQPEKTAERMALNKFCSLLESAVFALASRPEIDDDTVAVLVDPFATRLGLGVRGASVRLLRVKSRMAEFVRFEPVAPVPAQTLASWRGLSRIKIRMLASRSRIVFLTMGLIRGPIHRTQSFYTIS